jgi:mycothiol synthase
MGVRSPVPQGSPGDQLQRNRGLAQALLVDAFAAGRAHGALRQCLSTDSRSGALSLYEKVGMVVHDVWVNRAVGT